MLYARSTSRTARSRAATSCALQGRGCSEQRAHLPAATDHQGAQGPAPRATSLRTALHVHDALTSHAKGDRARASCGRPEPRCGMHTAADKASVSSGYQLSGTWGWQVGGVEDAARAGRGAHAWAGRAGATHMLKPEVQATLTAASAELSRPTNDERMQSSRHHRAPAREAGVAVAA